MSLRQTASLPPIAVFDLDGTLAHTAPDLIATLNHILTGEGLPPVPTESAGQLIGAGARALVERGFEAAGQEITPARLEVLFRAFMVHYGQNLCVGSRLYPNVVPALDALTERGVRLAVCTNKYTDHSVRLLDALGIGDRFAAICGRDSFPHFKPDPRHLTDTIAAAGGDPARAVMIGDSRTDVATAQTAGIPAVAVSFGYTDVPVRDLSPDEIIDDFAELGAAMERIEAARRGADGGRDRD